MTYDYEIWDGKKVIGLFRTTFKPIGNFLRIPENTGRGFKFINIPISYKADSDNGVKIVFKRCLDVSRKSRRQIDVIKKQALWTINNIP